MSEDEVVLSVLHRLEALGIDYMLVGSYASNFYGRPRSSFDADIVFRVAPRDVERFVSSFGTDFAAVPEILKRDLEQGSAFNLIPSTGLFKVDMVPVRKTFFAEEFGRRRRVKALGTTVWMASPEDVILSKLNWYRQGREVSERQLEDARDVYAAQTGSLDDAYLNRWSEILSASEISWIESANLHKVGDR